MRVLYTHDKAPFTEKEIKSCMMGVEDRISAYKNWEVPYFGTDHTSPTRYDELDVYDASPIPELLLAETRNLDLGTVLIVDRKLLSATDGNWTNSPEDMNQYVVWGIATPYLMVIMSTYGLDKKQQLKILKHEFGHFYGLGHCDSTVECIMKPIESMSVDDINDVVDMLCAKCVVELEEILEL